MPRRARIVVPNMPHHVVQRGHNRQLVFAGEPDYERYLMNLRELSDEFKVRVYAYCLMTNHVHLLLVPGESTDALGCLMKALAARATRYRNRIEGRSGTLWEGRFKSSPVQTDTYLLACTRYIELNPVRARMVPHAGLYPWSSYGQRIGQAKRWIDLNPAYLGLADNEAKRRIYYMRFLEHEVPEKELAVMREALQRGHLTGNKRFVDEIEQIVGQRIERRRPGRPKMTP